MPHRRAPRKPAPPPPAPEWTYNQQAQTYTRGNRGITPRRIIDARNLGISRTMPSIDALSARLSAGDITIQQWASQMRTIIKDVYTQQYILGRGGVNAMTQADYGRLGGILREQYGFLDSFARQIADGKLSPGQIQMRARMYVDSATQSFERARAGARGLVLPAYPGDGQTRCRARCKCRWDIRSTELAYECRWVLGMAEHCDDCLTNAGRWNPLMIPRFG